MALQQVLKALPSQAQPLRVAQKTGVVVQRQDQAMDLESDLLRLRAGFQMSFGDSCRIPDDRIDSRRSPLFMARAVMTELIEQLKPSRSPAT